MIISRRIFKLQNQFRLLRFDNNFIINNNNNQKINRIHRQYSSNNKFVSTTVGGFENPVKTYRLTLTAEVPFRCVSTSRSVFAEAKMMKGEGDQGLNLDYDDLIKAQKDESILIVDVREKEEINETGKLPGSIHVPMGEVANVLRNLSEEQFFDRFQKPKPNKDTKIIFSCRSGKRSATVQEEMIKLGYEKSYNYTGGWLDWESKQTPKA